MIKKIGKSIQHFNFFPLNYLEKVIIPDKVQPVNLLAIVGPPRTGSTLVYMLLAQAFHVYYLSNFEYVFYKIPYIAYLLRNCFNRHFSPKNYNSNYGYIPHLFAPAEANLFWEYWFDYFIIEKEPTFSMKKINYIKKVISNLVYEHNHTFLSGWNPQIFYMNHTFNIFDNCLFVMVRRDLIDVCISIYKTRESLNKDVNQWYSLKPAQCQVEEQSSCYDQIARQVYYIYQKADQYKSKLGNNFIDISYKELCLIPYEVLERIQKYANLNGIKLETSNLNNIPMSFQYSTYDKKEYFYIRDKFSTAIDNIGNNVI